MTTHIIGWVLIAVAILITLFLLKTLVWEFMKSSIMLLVIVMALYFIPIDWDRMADSVDFTKMKNFYYEAVSSLMG